MTKKIMNIAYLRCSSSIQDTAHQEASIVAYCSRNNITIDETISDEAISAYKKDISARDGMLTVLDLAHKGMINNLIIFETSRISRQFIESQTVIDELTKCGVSIHSVSDNAIINQNELDALMIAFKSFMNMKASKETGQRVKSAHALLREQGKHAAGALPYGYKLVDGYAVIDEEKASEIISFFEDYIVYGTKYVEEKYQIHNRATLINRISNSRYIEIVGEDLYNRANQVRNNRRCAPKSTASNLTRVDDALFEGMLYHKACGCKLYISRDSRTKNNRHYYRCKNCRGNTEVTDKKSFSGPVLDNNIESEILSVLDSLDHNKLQERYNSRCGKKKLVIEMQIKNLRHEVAEIRTTITKANEKLTTYILSDADDSLISTITSLISNKNEELAQLQLSLAEKEAELSLLSEAEKTNEALIANILHAKEIYSSSNNASKKAILQLLIQRIEVTDTDSVDIYLNI